MSPTSVRTAVLEADGFGTIFGLGGGFAGFAETSVTVCGDRGFFGVFWVGLHFCKYYFWCVLVRI